LIDATSNRGFGCCAAIDALNNAATRQAVSGRAISISSESLAWVNADPVVTPFLHCACFRL